MEEWTLVAMLSDLRVGSLKKVIVNGRELVLGRTHERLFAADLLCPHRAGPLDEGTIEGERIVCPWHAWEFDVRTGCYERFPATCLTLHEVQLMGEEIRVRLKENTR